MSIPQKNVYGEELQSCCKFPMTGYMRDGYCRLFPGDIGLHTACIEVTDDFLIFSKNAGNDLSTPMPDHDFPGLIAGDRWCLCALRWVEAYNAGAAPGLILSATHESILKHVPLNILKQFAVDDRTDEYE